MPASVVIGTRAWIARVTSWIAAEASGATIDAPDELSRLLVDDDREVPEGGLQLIPAGRRGKVRDELESVDAGRPGLVHVHAHRRDLGLHENALAGSLGSQATRPRREPCEWPARPGSSST